ncbi:DUF262 domain-containing protein [Candidatus Nitrosacidococcus sp. I8]|uniref:DUF262 domain-containing protein n=1 Tax=Candidatus Nitrosacidococcus sp. I8 TaxID=2942908 RepID=UPI002226FE26|nr:DUF262 domain-containing protein [Candidatus Nitrosacidococcus sp. I8]CAH9015613.1 hypothetical protein NURINAE_00176 [Candidatus Nitrosacidococcus sp. I8]
MLAKQTTLQEIIEGTRQYIVPLFQRTYSWKKKQWEVLWEDLIELSEIDTPHAHFMGSIVSVQIDSSPEGMLKFLLIDGQQRLTTIFIVLALLRNKLEEQGSGDFADEINDLLINRHKQGDDHYKLIPTQEDNITYQNLINNKLGKEKNLLTDAYRFFEKQLKETNYDFHKLKRIITNYLSIVSIVLDRNDNPYLVFESLNAKGQPLTQADLVRNHLFMQIEKAEQQEIYRKYWNPMQDALVDEKKDNLTEFIRRFLTMKEGNTVGKDNVYFTLKEKVKGGNKDTIEYIKELYRYSFFYRKIKNPAFEEEPTLQRCLSKLSRIEVTVAYPLILSFYNDYDKHRISKDDFSSLLLIIENYVIRRLLCNYPKHKLYKVFPTIYTKIQDKYSNNMIEGLKKTLQNEGYPKNAEFTSWFHKIKIYKSSSNSTNKFILEAIEQSYNHKESISFEKLTVEHIMPQTLTYKWKEDLGENWEEIYDQYLDTIGNLTLTGYNSELSNGGFSEKKKKLNESNLEMNKYFTQHQIERWGESEIKARAEILATKALEIWPYLGD